MRQAGAQWVNVARGEDRAPAEGAERLKPVRQAVLWARAHPARWWENLGLICAGLLALALTTWRLADNGYANYYYAAAVKSMAANGRAFFFASLDPGGFVSIDKPPLGFWIQVLTVRLLGFSPFAILLPQAIAGAIAPPLLGHFVRRRFTASAGLLAAFALALTPIWIVAARDNIVDVPLALTLLLAAGALLQATLSTRPTLKKRVTGPAVREVAWLVLAFALIGIGFNIKMLDAYLVVPAFAVAYLLFGGLSLPKRLAALLVSLLVLTAISLTWIEAVDLTPAAQRPYVGSTTTNSEFDLAFGYNGLSRLLGQSVEAGAALQFAEPEPSARVGEAGLLRLLQPELGPQASWLLPLALLGLIAAWPFTRPSRRRKQLNVEGDHGADTSAPNAALGRIRARQAGYIVWTFWLLTGLVFFSVARRIDTYYIVVIAPPLCAAVGFGTHALWRAYRSGDRTGWLLVAAAPATLWEQAYLLRAAPHWNPWLAPLLIAAGGFSGLVLGLLRARALGRAQVAIARTSPTHSGTSFRRLMSLAHSPALLAMLLVTVLVVPTFWTLGSLTKGNSNSHPAAGPNYARAGVATPPRADPRLLAFLEEQRRGAFYLVGVQDALAAAPLIYSTNAPIMTIGGFGGSDPILTPQTIQQLITANRIRFFLLPASNVTSGERAILYAQLFSKKKGILEGPAYHPSGPNEGWIAAHCTPVLPPRWSSARDARQRLDKYELFDCSLLANSRAT